MTTVSKTDEFCITNEKLCIKNEASCIKNDEFCALTMMNFAGDVMPRLREYLDANVEVGLCT